jgi:3-methyladenine DNA glycosylase AlkD
MNALELINHIRQFCLENESPENIIKYKRYFKEAPDSFGLTAAQLYEKTKQLLKAVNFETVLEAIPELLKRKSEETTLGLLLLNGFEKQYTKELFTEIDKWYSYSIGNWAHADTLGMLILPKLFKRGLIAEVDFAPWLTSTYKFQRRSVPVTLIKTLKTRNSFAPLFQFLEPLMLDPEREVHQGMGWFLRECWKLKASETEKFLMKWKEKTPRLIIQYATEKMTAEEKSKFRRLKPGPK